MPAQHVAKKTMFYNADRTKLVAEDSPDAAFLFVRAGSAIRDMAEAERLNYRQFEEVAEYDAVADHAAKHGGETQAQADANRQRMLAGSQARGGEDPDGPPAEGERSGTRAKAVKGPAEDK